MLEQVEALHSSLILEIRKKIKLVIILEQISVGIILTIFGGTG